MKVFRFIVLGLFGVLGITGCSRKVVPVSSTSTTTAKTDSTASSIKKDSSTFSHIETLTEKKLPEASVSLKLSRAQLDSLLNAMQSMPSVTRTIYYQDKATRAQLALLMDSLGNIQLKCTSLEKIYWEKNIQQSHYIQSLIAEVSKLRQEKSSVKEELRQVQKSWWERITENLLAKALLYFILGGLTVILIRIGLKKIPIIKNYIP